MRLDMSKRAKPAGRPEARHGFGPGTGPINGRAQPRPVNIQGPEIPTRGLQKPDNCEGAVNFDKEQ